MKKILYIIGVIYVMSWFASCSQDEFSATDGHTPDGNYTFQLGIEESDYVTQSRAAVTMSRRYLLEMYEGSLAATPVKMENTTGKFDVTLKKGVDYICLFWADGGTADYDAANLKAVKQTDETKVGTTAYCTKVTVNSKSFNGAVTLKRAVAELSFINKGELTEASNTLKITYPYAAATLNVGEGTVSYAEGTAVRTIENITPPAQITDAFASDYVLAPTVEGKLTGLKLQLNAETEKTLAETTIQTNYRTEILGAYNVSSNSMSSTIDASSIPSDWK